MKINVIGCHALQGSVGARGIENIKEEVLTRDFAKEIYNTLKSKGHEVNYISVDNSNIALKELQEEVKQCNNANAELNIFIHFNAYSLASANGSEIYTYSGKGIYNAGDMLRNLRTLGFKDRGVKCGAHLHVLKNTTAKSMLIEFCFITGSEDFNTLRTVGRKKMCKAITDTFSSIPAINKKCPTCGK